MSDIGCFSVSLAVRDIAASRAFYERLGFTIYAGAEAQNWLIMKQGTTNIGLFQGMFEGMMLTFNPGWDDRAQPVDPFEDIRALQARLEADGITLEQRTDPSGTGPASMKFRDPDGNLILIDQHR